MKLFLHHPPPFKIPFQCPEILNPDDAGEIDRKNREAQKLAAVPVPTCANLVQKDEPKCA